MQIISLKTCIKFLKNFGENLVVIQKIRTLPSEVTNLGYQNTTSNMFLEEPISNLGPILKKLMHVLGFQDEHKRPDRNNYINVNLENIPEELHN